MICPTCNHEVKNLFSDWDNPINNGILNICEFCATDEQAENSKSLQELNELRKEQYEKTRHN